jgi:hypothetical protein
MMLRHKTVKRIIRGAAVLVLASGGFFGLAVTPAFANVPPTGWSLVGWYSTNAACRAAGAAGEGAFEWTNYGCFQPIPPHTTEWALYVN